MESASATNSPDPAALVSGLYRRYIRPHATGWNVAVAVVAGVITVVFGTIILLMVMVAANFNLLGFIE